MCMFQVDGSGEQEETHADTGTNMPTPQGKAHMVQALNLGTSCGEARTLTAQPHRGVAEQQVLRLCLTVNGSLPANLGKDFQAVSMTAS